MIDTNISIQRPIDYYIDITQRENSLVNNFCIEKPINTYNIISATKFDFQYIIDKINKIFEYKSTNTTSIGENVIKKYYKQIDKIEYNNYVYEFNINFIYSIYLCENIFISENEYLDIIGYGDTAKDAEQDMYSTLEDLWNIYVLEDDKNLDIGAKKLKYKLQENIIRKEC